MPEQMVAMVAAVQAQDGEEFSGYLKRCRLLGQRLGEEGDWSHPYGGEQYQPAMVLPSGLDAMARMLSPVFGSGFDILAGHTMLPLHLPFATVAKIPAILDHALVGAQVRGLHSSLGLVQRGLTSKPRLSLCTQCVAEDMERLGFAYWHRDHQCIGLGYCATHGCPLVAGCGRCSYSQAGSSEPRLPKAKCWCGKPHNLHLNLMPDEDGEVLTRLAIYAKEILEGALADWTAAEVGIYYQTKARELGYGTGAYIQSRELAMDALVPYSDQVLSRLNAGGGARGPKWMQQVLAQGMAPNVVGRNLLMFDIFGACLPDEEDLRMARETVATGRSKTSEYTVGLDRHAAEDDRLAITEYLAKHPQAGRKELNSVMHRTVSRVRARDLEWFEELLPSRRHVFRSKGSTQQDEVLAARDLRTSKHIRSRHAELLAYEGTSPTRMTKQMLLKGVTMAQSITVAALDELPLTRQALEECEETREAFGRRFATCILKYGEGDARQRYSSANRRTKLGPDVLDEIGRALGLPARRRMRRSRTPEPIAETPPGN